MNDHAVTNLVEPPVIPTTKSKIALLTAGKDRHYVIGLLRALLQHGIHIECIGGDEVANNDVVHGSRVDFRNFIGGQETDRGLKSKVLEILSYYGRLIAYAARTDARIFHILWFRKFPRLEGVLLTAYLRLLGKKVVFTAHNVDANARDGGSTLFNRFCLRFLYHTVDQVLVHTQKMKDELVTQFGVREQNVAVVPFGINDVIPQSARTRAEAKREIGIEPDEKVLLFFGTIVPYKGLDDLLQALSSLVGAEKRLKLIIAGPVWSESRDHWRDLEAKMLTLGIDGYVRKEVQPAYLSDEDVARFFRASDVSILPYKKIYQSGVLALSYNQGIPVIAARVGSFPEDVEEGKTGLLFRPGDTADLAEKIRSYFESDMYREIQSRSRMVREYGMKRFSWERNAQITFEVYQSLLTSSGR